MLESIIAPADTDDTTEQVIKSYLDYYAPQSFFLYAGAGSGKTRSLVNAVKHVTTNYSRVLELRGQSVAVITYTNAAADEISERLEFSPLVHVSTIHSFAWALIRDFQNDIRETLRAQLINKLRELESKSSRAGSKREATRLHDIERTKTRLESLDSISRFTYNPSGDQRTRDSLNHSEVISLTVSLLGKHRRLVDVLASRYPYLFVDESQDTNGNLLDAFLEVERIKRPVFCLGLFGDTMQRIYNDGKEDLEGALDENWRKPAKTMNHRSRSRIVELANSIRNNVDAHAQFARPERAGGLVRLFLANSSMPVDEVESYVVKKMSTLSRDKSWNQSHDRSQRSHNGVKKLILEHHMAAKRLGFSELFESLIALQSDRTAVLEGRHPEVLVFTHEVVPLVQAATQGDEYAVMAILRERSPLLAAAKINKNSLDGHTTADLLSTIDKAVNEVTELWSGGNVPTLFEVTALIHKTGLFDLPDSVVRAQSFLSQPGEAQTDDSQPWVRILRCTFEELENYTSYTAGQSEFTTHQGVKGLEFPRVMVIISDEESKGFMFSYEKLFGAKDPTDADRQNKRQGKETSLDRTRRLFYVTCTRAQDSLAVVAYTKDPGAVKRLVSEKKWFQVDEIELVTSDRLNNAVDP